MGRLAVSGLMALLWARGAFAATSEWKEDRKEEGELSSTTALQHMRIFRGARGSSAGTCSINARHGLCGYGFERTVMNRLQRFGALNSGARLSRGHGYLMVRAKLRADFYVVLCRMDPADPQWLTFELDSAKDWQARVSDLMTNCLGMRLSASDLDSFATVRPAPSRSWFVSKELGAVGLPPEWFDVVCDGACTVPDVDDYRQPALVRLKGSKGDVSIQAAKGVTQLTLRMAHHGRKAFNPKTLHEGVNKLPPPQIGHDRRFVVKRRSKYVVLIEREGPVRDGKASTEALARYFYRLLRRR